MSDVADGEHAAADWLGRATAAAADASEHRTAVR
jgi:hypothetical protein